MILFPGGFPMDVKIPAIQAPAGATVNIRVEVTAPLNITPFVARQTVNAFVVTEISTHLRSEPPDLIVGESLRWSVPVVLTCPTLGVVGKVGELLVDATTGELLVDEETVRRMSEDVNRLAERSLL
jgi:hypothetical protein